MTKQTLATRRIKLAGWFLSTIVGLAFLLVGAPVATAQKDSTTSGKSRYAKLDERAFIPEPRQRPRSAGVDSRLDLQPGLLAGSSAGFCETESSNRLDLPGHGLSDKPELAYSMDLFAKPSMP